MPGIIRAASDPLWWFTVVVGGGLACVLFFTIHRIWFHPLSKFPGPWIAKVTNLYSAYHGWKGDIHIDILQCHMKYGDFVRYAPNRLIVNTSTGLKEIYSHSSPVQKSTAYNVMVHRAPNILTAIDKKSHGFRKRILAHALSDNSIRRYEPIIMRHVRKFCDVVKSSASETEWSHGWNLGTWSTYLTFDIMSDVVFGEKYELLDKPKYRYVPEAIEASNVRISTVVQADELGRWKVDRRLFPRAILARNTFIRFVGRLLHRRMNVAPMKRDDIFTYLLDAKDEETDKGFTTAEIGAEATTLIVAGSDTSSTALAGVLFYLSRYPDAYSKVVAEVRSAFPTPSDVRMGPELNSCVYLRACIDESMRMSPPGGSPLWREVNSKGLVIDGHYVPSGCDVGVGVYALHHNESYHRDPFTFRPERWLNVSVDGKASEGKSPETARAREAFVPFSIGPRSCIGKGFALVELQLALATILCSFDIKRAVGSDGKLGGGDPNDVEEGRRRENEFQLWDHITGYKKGPVLQFRIVRA